MKKKKKKKKKNQSFLSENLQFLKVKFSIYLNRRVFVIEKISFRKGFMCKNTKGSHERCLLCKNGTKSTKCAQINIKICL